MTIIHISGSLGGGGAEQMVLQLATQSNLKYKTIVISVSNDNTLEDKFIANNIECHFLNINSFKNSTLTQGIKKLHHLIKDLPNPVFHCHLFHSALLATLYNLRYRRIPIVFTLHSSTLENVYQKSTLFLTKPFRNKDIIFSQNAEKWFLKNSVIIPNGVDIEALSINIERQYNMADTFRFLYLGRLSKEKNPLLMITAAQKLLKEGVSNFNFDVIGDGLLRKELELEVKKNNLESHFNIFGFQKNIKPYLEEAQCLILPSHWEGMPVALIEAAAAKLPIISTPVGSVPDFINENNGYLSSVENFPETMLHVMTNYNIALDKSDKLFEEIKTKFNIKNVFDKHLKVYNELAS